MLPAMEHPEPSSKELPKSCAQSAIPRSWVLFTSSNEAAFGDLGNAQGKRYCSSAQAVSHDPAQQKPPSPTHFQILQITT